MRRRAFLVGAAGASVLSGCLSALDQNDETASGDSQDDGPAGTQSATAQNDGLAGTPLDDLDRVRVPVEINYGPDARDVTDIVLDALSFWEDNAGMYAGFDVVYERVDEDPYLTIDLQSTLTSCESYGDVNGCATIPRDRLPDKLEAVVQTALTDQGVFTTAVHELGHTLGLTHDDDPQQYMIARWEPPWQRDTANVYLDGVTPAEDIVAGIEWLGERSDAVRADVEWVSERSAAGVVVQVGGDLCRSDDGSDLYLCAQQGTAYEDQYIIQLAPEMAVDVRAWNVARALADSGDNRPEMLSIETPDEVRRSEWWDEESTTVRRGRGR